MASNKKKKSFVTPHISRHWTIRAGLVQVPVSLARMFNDVGDGRVPGHNLCPEHKQPLGKQNVCKRLVKGKQEIHTVEGDVLKGYEYEAGKYAILDASEAAALPLDHDGEITLKACVNSDTLERWQVEQSYFAFPVEDETLANYAALLGFLTEHHEKALLAVGTWYGSTRAYIITAFEHKDGPVVAVSLCNYVENLRSDSLETIQRIELPALSKQEKAQADAFFGAGLPTEFDWSAVTDTVAERQRNVIAEKVATGKVVVPDQEPSKTPDEIPDIFEAMREQMAAVTKKAKTKTQKLAA